MCCLKSSLCFFYDPWVKFWFLSRRFDYIRIFLRTIAKFVSFSTADFWWNSHFPTAFWRNLRFFSVVLEKFVFSLRLYFWLPLVEIRIFFFFLPRFLEEIHVFSLSFDEIVFLFMFLCLGEIYFFSAALGQYLQFPRSFDEIRVFHRNSRFRADFFFFNSCFFSNTLTNFVFYFAALWRNTCLSAIVYRNLRYYRESFTKFEFFLGALWKNRAFLVML